MLGQKGRKIYIHAGVNVGSDTEKFLKNNPDYIPFLFEPNPVFSSRLQKLAKEYDGEFYQRAAWITDGETLEFKQNRKIWKNGVGGSLFTPTVTRFGSKRYVSKTSNKALIGRFDNATVPESFLVVTIDLSRFIKERFSIKDEIILRLDVEGAEYKILRKFFTDGIHCYFNRVEYEAHAMFSEENYKYKSFDAVFPWLVSSCGTEVELEALHLGGAILLEEIFDKKKLSVCEACALPPIMEDPEYVSNFRPGWWLFRGEP